MKNVTDSSPTASENKTTTEAANKKKALIAKILYSYLDSNIFEYVML